MSSVLARYEVSGERRKPKPSGSTSSVPPPKMLSPFLAWFLSSAKISSCLRMRFALSTSFLVAMSRSSETWRFFRSDKCIDCDPYGWEREKRGKAASASGPPVSCRGAGRPSPESLRGRLWTLDVAVNKCRELGFG